ncbi:mannose-1-phosphate guanylyltransferase/mannose-6-phosphate isomerase, partial [Pseudoalteromonas sp. S2755]
MAGGAGTRLWPFARGNSAKNFLKWHGQNTMHQETILRLNGLAHSPAMLICKESPRLSAAEQVRQIGVAH